MVDAVAIAITVQAAIQALLTQLQAKPAAPAAVTAPIFVRPSATTVINFIDYSTKVGTQMYTINTDKFKNVLHINKPHNTAFCNELQTKVTEAKWKDLNIFNISIRSTANQFSKIATTRNQTSRKMTNANAIDAVGQATIQGSLPHVQAQAVSVVPAVDTKISANLAAVGTEDAATRGSHQE